jgi:RNase P subunit RPR2
MPCEKCKRFPVPTSNFEEVDFSIERHGTLYRCKNCGNYIEIIEEERSVKFTPIDELKKYYDNIE